MDGCRWVAERVHRVGLLCALAQLASRSLWCDGAALQAHLAGVAQAALAGALPASKDACTLAQLRTLFDWSPRRPASPTQLRVRRGAGACERRVGGRACSDEGRAALHPPGAPARLRRLLTPKWMR